MSNYWKLLNLVRVIKTRLNEDGWGGWGEVIEQSLKIENGVQELNPIEKHCLHFLDSENSFIIIYYYIERIFASLPK